MNTCNREFMIWAISQARFQEVVGNHRPLVSIEFNNRIDLIVYHILFWGAIACYVFGVLFVILISLGIHFSQFRNKTNSRILIVFLISLPFLLFLSLSSFTMLTF